ncbi:MAG: SDR family oxidoreductase [Anaerolineales bacterium]|nr:SDR family oxidoreductase [Anaerolineales bacterium]
MKISDLLQGQVALVTGASRGIGRATALLLAQAGASVILAARSADEINSLADEIKHYNGKALAIPTDVSDVAQVDYLLVLTLRAFGHIDILVNNAALVQPLGKVWETSPTAWQKLIAVNVIGPYLCARAVLPQMIERGSGCIINVSSALAERNLEGASAYNASKAALERFSGTLAAEVKNTGVVVTTLRPGMVDTPMQAEIRRTPAHIFPKASRWEQAYTEGRLHPPTEPAQAILWLASHFGRDCNGQLVELGDPVFRQRVTTDLGE